MTPPHLIPLADALIALWDAPMEPNHNKMLDACETHLFGKTFKDERIDRILKRLAEEGYSGRHPIRDLREARRRSLQMNVSIQ